MSRIPNILLHIVDLLIVDMVKGSKLINLSNKELVICILLNIFLLSIIYICKCLFETYEHKNVSEIAHYVKLFF